MSKVRSIKQVALGELLASQLRDRIVAGDIPAGTRLVEDVVAEEYEVSRGPVRDAISILRRENLLTESGRQGVAVRALQASDVERLFDLRFALERLAIVSAFKCAQHRGADAWLPCEEPLAQMEELAAARRVDGFAEADLAFHTGFYEIADSAPLRAAWDLSRPLFAALQKVTLAYDRAYDESAAAHRILLQTAQAGDLVRIDAELARHLGGAHRRRSWDYHPPARDRGELRCYLF